MQDRLEDLGPEETYFAHLRQGVFALQHCRACDSTIFPPKDVCPQCTSPGLEWQSQSGEGEVYSCTTVRVVGQGELPHNVSLISLEGGIRLMSTVANIPADNVQIGMRVKARVEVSAERSRLVFDAVVGEAK